MYKYIPFLTDPVALWKYLSLHTHTEREREKERERDKSAANTTTKHPHTPNSSQTVTAINGTEPSWELQILLKPKPVEKRTLPHSSYTATGGTEDYAPKML